MFAEARTAACSLRSFGLTGSDLNAQNDYDGDGKTDIAVWRNTNGTFYVQQSSSTDNTLVYHWGIPNDFPVAELRHALNCEIVLNLRVESFRTLALFTFRLI